MSEVSAYSSACLCVCARAGRSAVVQYLVEEGADPALKANDGSSLFDLKSWSAPRTASAATAGERNRLVRVQALREHLISVLLFPRPLAQLIIGYDRVVVWA